MIEPVTLPFDAALTTRPLLPVSYDLCNPAIRRERQERVNMVRHQKKQTRPPNTGSVSMLDGFENLPSDQLVTQRVAASQTTVQGHEVDLARRIDPQRRIVRERFASCHGRAGCRPREGACKVSCLASPLQGFKVGRLRRGVPTSACLSFSTRFASTGLCNLPPRFSELPTITPRT